MRVLTRSPQIKRDGFAVPVNSRESHSANPFGKLVPMLAVFDATLERARRRWGRGRKGGRHRYAEGPPGHGLRPVGE